MPRLRHGILLLIVAGCGRDEVLGPDAPVVIDGTPIDGTPPVDAEVLLCTAAVGTANVSVDGSGPAVVERRLYAGGQTVGPVAGPIPHTFALLFTNTDPFDPNEFSCCIGGDSGCCATVGVMVTTPLIATGAEVGTHPITATRTDDATFSLDGTLTITDYVDPFLGLPGHITGSVSATMGSDSVDGTFDGDFCPYLIVSPI